MANRKAGEKDDIDRMFEGINFHGMTAEKVRGQGELLKQPTGRGGRTPQL